ncbi:MAG: hypothetical protein GY798_22025 [Hyphomicrobiales bacterium]|nr:hypothetical protein [Hyphomicrobiales bacterium]
MESLVALRREPSRNHGVLRLANDLTSTETASSAMAHNCLALLSRAADGSGLKLTATGNLTRTVVAEMIDLFEWPDFDRKAAFRLNKVINEPDFLPLFFVRHIAEFAKLVRKYRGSLRATRHGKDALAKDRQRALQAILFHTTFWRTDLGYLGPGMDASWPGRDIGILLWSLSVAATEWQTPERLTRLCTIPTTGMLQATWDTGSFAMQARILRPLYWFGLIEHRREKVAGAILPEQSFYRKAPLFDRFLTFDVQTEQPQCIRH